MTEIPPSSGLAPAICMVHVINAPLTDAANAASHVQVQGAAPSSMFYLNSKPVTGTQLQTLKHGDVLSLMAFNGVFYHSYQVRIQETDRGYLSLFRTSPTAKGSSPAKDTAAGTASPLSVATNSHAHPATEECTCPFCLEIQVQSTTLVPCGHSFCEECVVNCQECPTVRIVTTQSCSRRHSATH